MRELTDDDRERLGQAAFEVAWPGATENITWQAIHCRYRQHWREVGEAVAAEVMAILDDQSVDEALARME